MSTIRNTYRNQFWMIVVGLGVVLNLSAQSDHNRREHFGQQLFLPKGGFLLRVGDPFPRIIWENPKLVETLTNDSTLRTRWFDEELHEVTEASRPGRYFAYGEATGPEGSILRRALTCICIEQATNLPESWQNTEEGAVNFAARIESGGKPEPRPGQWLMENATQHVRLKRKIMGWEDRAPVVVSARPIAGDPAAVLRRESRRESGLRKTQIAAVEARLDLWYQEAKEPTAIVLAKNGIIQLAKSYGNLEGQAVTIDTPMRLDSAMKPLMGIQLAMYADRDLIDFEQPIGEFLPDFATPVDNKLTFRSGHAHLSGIHFPWPLAFSRIFYFRTWQDSMIAHQPREWQAGSKQRYGVVGVILAVRSLELISGRNYWDAMEREVFEPLGIRNIWPGGSGFSAENLARIGVLLDNRGKYGEWELFSEETYQKIVPQSLKPWFPEVDKVYGVGLQSHSSQLGPGSFGHGGGCGTHLSVDPAKHLVFAMVRNERGENYRLHLKEVMKLLKQ